MGGGRERKSESEQRSHLGTLLRRNFGDAARTRCVKKAEPERPEEEEEASLSCCCERAGARARGKASLRGTVCGDAFEWHRPGEEPVHRTDAARRLRLQCDAIMRCTALYKRDENQIENFNFSGRTGGLSWRGAHRQPQACSTVLLQIQIGRFDDPPIPSA